MPFSNEKETGRPVTIFDEGVTLTNNVNSLDFTGAGVTATALGANVTTDIPGDVAGPGSSTDNAIVRWNGTDGDAIQNSTAILSDNGGVLFTQSAVSGGEKALEVVAGAHTNLSGTFVDALLNLGREITFTSVPSYPDHYVGLKVPAATLTSSGGSALAFGTQLFIPQTTVGAAQTVSTVSGLVVGDFLDNSINARTAYGLVFGMPGSLNGVTYSGSIARAAIRTNSFGLSVNLGNQTATADFIDGLSLTTYTITASTNTVTVNRATNIYVEGPPSVSGTAVMASGVVPYSIFVDAGPVRFDADLRFGASTTVTADQYQIFRDSGDSDRLHFNAPTGGAFEFSVNDSGYFTLSASDCTFQNIDIGQSIGANGPIIKQSVVNKGAGISFESSIIGSGSRWQMFTKGAGDGDFFFGRTGIRDNIVFAATKASVYVPGPNAGSSVPSGSFSLMVSSGTDATYVPIIVRANASQSANLQEWQNSAGTVLAKVTATGAFSLFSSTPLLTIQDSVNSGANTYIPRIDFVTSTSVVRATIHTNGTVTGALSIINYSGSPNGAIHFRTGGVQNCLIDSFGRFGIGTLTPSAGLQLSPQHVATSGTERTILVSTSAHTGQTASTEIHNVAFNTYTRTWATGNITLQREAIYSAPTYAFAGSSTVTVAATFTVSGAPIQGTNATISNTVGLMVGNPLSTVTSAVVGASIAAVIVPEGIANGVGAVTERTGLLVTSAQPLTLGDQTATLTNFFGIKVESQSLSSTTNTRTITNAASLYVEGPPSNNSNVAFTNGPYSLWVDAGLSRFDGDGTRVFELPADATGNTSAATGRIPVLIGGSTKYLRYYDD